MVFYVHVLWGSSMASGDWIHCSSLDPLACRHGFWGIFLLAAWPNALFDLCGICCGHFLMPFWEFIGATMAGKALVKARPPLSYPGFPDQAEHPC